MNSIRFISGADPIPTLPGGWTVERHPGSVALVFSPARKRYLAGEPGLYPLLPAGSSQYPLEIDQSGLVEYATLQDSI